MKLYNVIVVYDVYAVAESHEKAREAVLMAIVGGDGVTPESPSEQTAIESRENKNIRDAWIEQKPFVGDDVSDQDFESLRGKNTVEIHAMLYKKKVKADK